MVFGSANNNIISNITAISIERSGRFGNSIVQLSHAYHIAKAIGVTRIYVPDFWYIPEGTSKTTSGIELINVSQSDFSLEKVVLEGMFFFYEALAGLSNTKPNHYLNIIDLIEVTNLKYPSQSLGKEDLVIHIRSGDIFINPHSHYGQAPLSFFKKIIELQSWHSISLVFEDKSNPIIDPLIDFSKQCCLQVQEISGELKSDIEYLLKAKVLVVSNGTFGSAIAVISKNLETVYYFETGFSSWGNPNILSIRVADQQGIYKSKILSQNWQNTESQRKLMLKYPIDALDFDPVFTH
ncbi:hypothetical protein [Planktothrix sp.]|uniref:hypothetical protein n=1 Tax=Planktothrix sp. TaxID=3088171 RepID=UPI0038D510EC